MGSRVSCLGGGLPLRGNWAFNFIKKLILEKKIQRPLPPPSEFFSRINFLIKLNIHGGYTHHHK
jgi:hypothetical protein